MTGDEGAEHDVGEGDRALIGRTVAGKFVVERYLGGGAMGAVYRAHFTTLDKPVAIKVMHGALLAEPNYAARFKREAKVAARLEHPNSIRVIDSGEEPDGLLYIVMEYVEGRDLHRVMQEDWPLSNEDIVDILAQALAALAVAHEMGVVHRDLKPENLMVLPGRDDGEEGRYLVKVCDFGVAKVTKESGGEASSYGKNLTTHGLVVGTPEYMSPEQARGEPLDARADIYAIGILLYQLLTGRTPFEADSPLQVVLLHVTKTPEPPHTIYADVHRGLEAVALKALAKDPADRYASAREMRAALRAAIGIFAKSSSDMPPATRTSESASARPPRVSAVETGSANVTTERPPRSRKKSPGSGLLALLAVGLLVAGAAVAHRMGLLDTVLGEGAAPESSAAPGLSSAPALTTQAPSAAPSESAAPVHHAPPAKPSATTSATSIASGAPSASAAPVKPPFHPASCKAQVGATKKTGAFAAKDLKLNTTAAAWTECAQRLKERPASPIASTVHLRFRENKTFLAATCAACPAPVAACVAQNTGKTVALDPKATGTGEASFDVPLSIACD